MIQLKELNGEIIEIEVFHCGVNIDFTKEALKDMFESRILLKMKT